MNVTLETPLSLSQAQGHWELGKNWVVQTPQGDVLWDFSAGFDEHKVMSAIRLGRKYELEAFQRGIEFGKETAARSTKQHVELLEGQLRSLTVMNENLSEELERQIAGG